MLKLIYGSVNLTGVVYNLSHRLNELFAVVRQQFVLGINCSIFQYRNWFGANQRLAQTRKSFKIAQVSLFAVQQV